MSCESFWELNISTLRSVTEEGRTSDVISLTREKEGRWGKREGKSFPSSAYRVFPQLSVCCCLFTFPFYFLPSFRCLSREMVFKSLPVVVFRTDLIKWRERGHGWRRVHSGDWRLRKERSGNIEREDFEEILLILLRTFPLPLSILRGLNSPLYDQPPFLLLNSSSLSTSSLSSLWSFIVRSV